jgi:hypothetical protein
MRDASRKSVATITTPNLVPAIDPVQRAGTTPSKSRLIPRIQRLLGHHIGPMVGLVSGSYGSGCQSGWVPRTTVLLTPLCRSSRLMTARCPDFCWT